MRQPSRTSCSAVLNWRLTENRRPSVQELRAVQFRRKHQFLRRIEMDAGRQADTCLGEAAPQQTQSVGLGDSGAALAAPYARALGDLQDHQVASLHAGQA